DDKRLFLAAMRVVAEAGAAGRNRLDNFYFMTPGDRMVMFAPDRKDRLRYYRETAPASLTFSGNDFGGVVRPENDPTGATRCTGLKKIISDPTAPETIACMTPIYLQGRYVGAWGATMPIDSYLSEAVRNAPKGATTLILSAKGALIAYPGFTRP